MNKLDCDVLIIGGGINGCGIAADASSRGLKVVLCEQGDLAQETSSASSKLIHGGLRYLEQYDFGLVRKALKERELLFKLCPHLIHPLAFVLPHQQHLRPFWFIRLGLFLYDHLSRTQVSKTKILRRKTQPNYFSQLRDKIHKGFLYYDGQTIDSRLVIANAQQAKKNQAIILTRTQFINTDRSDTHWLSKLKSPKGTIEVKSKILVNAAGPWTAQLNQLIGIDCPYKLIPVQGSHFVVRKLYDGEHAYILQNSDNRIIFTIPYMKDFTLVGTTDTKLSALPTKIKMTTAEKKYLLELVNSYFTVQLAATDIVHEYCGIRPLIENDTEQNAKNISRDFKIYSDHQQAPYTCILGGKLTTFRVLAKECVDGWKTFLPNLPKCQTHRTALPGGNFENIEIYKKKLQKKYNSLSPFLVERYVSLYGSNSENLLGACQSLSDLGINFGENLFQQEVDYLVKNEWAQTTDDILWRRTKLGLIFSDEQKLKLNNYLMSS